MHTLMRGAIRLGVSLLAVHASAAGAQTFDSGSTGADGAFTPTEATTTLALPPSGVFHFTTVNIPAGVTVRFTRNATNTPVTILASGDVTIAGTIDVGGAKGANGSNGTVPANSGGAGGPGGFDGGSGSSGIVSTSGGQGLGPGGGGAGTPAVSASGGGFGTTGGGPAGGAAYGAATLVPMIGGSGGGGGGANLGVTSAGGGGGGGALTIVSSGTITVTGSLIARGGDGGGRDSGSNQSGGAGGSGGGIRLIAATVGGGGTISVAGGAGGASSSAGAGGVGRVRVEAFTTSALNYSGLVPSFAAPTSVTLPSAPALAITAVGGVTAPAAPAGSYGVPDITLPAGTTSPVTVAIGASNIPAGTVVTVTAKGQVGAASSATATLEGTSASSTASASVAIPVDQPCVISASATFSLVAAGDGAPVYADGEEVEQVRVSAVAGGATQVTYVTRSGREVLASALR
jgi:hypothetical protein